MPEIGHRETVTAFTLDAEARGGAQPTTDRDSKEYEPPEGYILINHKEITEVNRGIATASTGTAPAGYRIINTEDIRGNLEAHVEWRYAKIWGTVDLDSRWNNIRRQVEEYQVLRRRIVGNATARGEQFGAGAHIRITVEAVIEYVGTPSDVKQYIDKILAGVSVPDIRVFDRNWKNRDADVKLEYRQGTSNQSWDYDLYMISTKPEQDYHYVYYSMGGKTGNYRFLPTIRTEGASRTVIIALQEDLSGQIIGSNNQTISVGNTNTKFDLTYTKQREDSTLAAWIYWSDDRNEPLILGNFWTFISYPS
ncbi:hypothetical protein [Bacillus velezensis]|uniref:hypothetical protein n=1 Tax=Bacillus velezensis TaxID=492670 RepID=UPI000D3DA279|nr:hypothetical protein [Bacillus velezensis]